MNPDYTLDKTPSSSPEITPKNQKLDEGRSPILPTSPHPTYDSSPSQPIQNASIIDINKIKEMIQSGNMKSLKSTLTKDLILNMGYLLIDFAMDTKNEEVAAFLREQGAPISEASAKKAIEMDILPFVKDYLENNKKIPTQFLKQAIHCSNSDMIKLLVEHHAPDDGKVIKEALIYADDNTLQYLLSHGYKPSQEALEEAKNANQVDSLLKYNTPISQKAIKHMAQKGWDRHLKAVINKGMKIPLEALSLAASKGHLSTVELLINNKAPFKRDLMAHAGKSGDIEIIKKLLQYGVPINEDSLQFAITNGHKKAANFLLDKGAKIGALDVVAAIRKNDEALVCELIQRGGPKDDKYLAEIPSKCEQSLFDYLLSITKKIPNNALRKACSQQSHEKALLFAKALIQRDAPKDPKALNECVANGNLEALTYLMSLNISTKKIKFSDAIGNKHFHIANYLLTCPDISIDSHTFHYEMSEDLKRKIFEVIQNRVMEKSGENGLLENIQKLLDVFIATIDKSSDTGKSQDLIQWIEATLFAGKSSNLPLEHLALYFLIPSATIWKLLFPHFDVPEELKNLSPWGFDPDVYKKILPLTEEACHREGNTGAEKNAYKLTVLFGSKDRAEVYLKQAKKTDHPVYDACQFELPKNAVWDIEFWRNFLEKYGFAKEKMQLLALSPAIEASINGAFTPYRIVQERIQKENLEAKPHELQQKMVDHYREELLSVMRAHPHYSKELTQLNPRNKIHQKQIRTLLWKAVGELLPTEKKIFLEKKQNSKKKVNDDELLLIEFLNFFVSFRDFPTKKYNDIVDIVVRRIYGKIDEKYLDAAYEFVKYGISKTHFDEALDIIKKGPKKLSYIPNVKIEGSLIGQPPYLFETMSTVDPMIFILGKKTSCCQNIDGNGRDSVLHGATQPYGGFVRILKRGSADPWVAQSWVGLTEDNEILFDSIEYNKGHDPQVITELYSLAATAILLRNPKIKRVLFGKAIKDQTYPLLQRPKEGYSRIIGYKNVGYDSKNERYILAEQGKLDVKKVELVKNLDLLSTPQEMTDDGLALIQGNDAYVNKGQKLQRLSLNAVDRIRFFEEHPKAQELLRNVKSNPLVEEGFYDNKNKTGERFGEYFLPFKAVKKLVNLKIKGKTNCKADHVVLVEKDPSELTDQLKNIKLKEGNNILIGYMDRADAVGAYIERIDGKLKCVVVDTKSSDENSPVCHCIRSAFPGIDLKVVKEDLQVDYDCSSTVLIQSLMYFAKHGKEMLGKMDEGKTPAALLKMAQRVGLESLSPETKDEIVSFKKGLTLGQYIQKHQVNIGGKTINAAAIRKKYHYFDQLENCRF